MNVFKLIVLFIWQLPQNLVGLIVKLVNLKKITYEYSNCTLDLNIAYIKPLFDSAVSLGRFILADDRIKNRSQKEKERCISHEIGHTYQSKYLGPLYLIVIGLPSLIGNLLHRAGVFKNYYAQPWEKWADKLGKVER